MMVFEFSYLLLSLSKYANVVVAAVSKKLFQKRNKEIKKKNKLNNKLININKAKRHQQQQQQQVKNVYFYRFCCFVVRFAACRNLYPRDTSVHVCAYVYLYHPSVCYSYS